MKRSYDFSFVDDTEDITSAIDAHSLQQHIATPATQTSLGLHTVISASPFLNHQENLSLLERTVELRVPLLTSAIGFNPDFQSNTGLVRTNLQLGNSLYHSSFHRLNGLGIRYEGPSTTASDQYGNTPPKRQLTISEPSSEDLSLHDICHIDSSPHLGFSTPNVALSYEHTGPEEAVCDTSTGDAYSNCPTLDYTAHAASISCSVSSLSYGSGSDASLKDSLDVNCVKDKLQVLLDSYSPHLCSGNSSVFETNPMVGLYADINMRELAVKRAPPELGVNPADIMGENSDVKVEDAAYDSTSSSQCEHSLTADHSAGFRDDNPGDGSFSDEAINAIVSVLSAPKREEDALAVHLSAQPMYSLTSAKLEASVPAQTFYTHPTMLIGPTLPPTTDASFSFVSPRLLTAQPAFRAPLANMFASQGGAEPYFMECLPIGIKLQSPVLNAHLGIELDELRRRADEFRRLNPGSDLDKTWLQAYAGRLSQRGELIEDYRCYVNGCSQRNKRRDHILVHVGSHVEHRPFQCSHCGMRFLRKNECKRHESSHGGHKPFQCQICAPFQDRSFVRQDLLKRHMRVTHGVQSETTADRRKRMRAMADEDYWP